MASEFIEILSPDAEAQLKAIMPLVEQLANNIKSINGFKTSSTPSGADKGIQGMNEAYKSQNKELEELRKKLLTIASLNKQRYQEEAKLIADNDKALSYKSDKELKQMRDKQAMIASLNKQKNEEIAQANKSALANEKLNRAYVQLTASREKAKNKLQDLISSENASNKEIRIAQKEFDVLNKKVGQADKAIGKMSQSNNGLKTLTSSVTNLMSAFGLTLGIGIIADITKNIYNTTKELQSLNMALKSVTRTQEEFNAQQIFLKDISMKYGLEIKSLTKQFTDFYVSAKDKSSGAEIQQIFKDISRAGSALGTSNEAMERAFLAVTQMMSKGTVSSEELRRQLAEALPGSVQAMTRAVQKLHPEIKNLTEKGLFEMIKKGKILASEVLPETARQLAIITGADSAEKIETITKSTNRLKDAWVEFIKFINENDTFIGTMFNGAIEGATLFLKGLQEILSTQDQINKNREGEQFQQGSEDFTSSFGINVGKKSEKEQKDYLNKQKKELTDYVNEQEKEVSRLTKIVDDADWWSPEWEVKDLAEQTSKDIGYAKGQLYSINQLLNPIKKPDSSIDDVKLKNPKRQREHLDLTEYTSAIELRKAELEREKSILEDRMNNEETSLDERLKLRSEFSSKSIQILDEEMQKEQAISTKKAKDDLAKNELALKNKDINPEEYSKNKIAVANRLSNELAKIDIDYSTKWNDIMDADADYYKKIQKEKRDLADETASILISIEKDKFDKIVKNEELGINYSLKARQKAFDASLALSRKELDLQKIKDLAHSTSDEETAKIEANYKKADKAINDLISPMKQAHEETIKFIESFTDGSLDKALESIGFKSAKMFLDFDVNGQSTFEKLWEGAETTKEKFALAFQAIGDVVQDSLAVIGENSDKHYASEFAKLDKQKEDSLAFAGDSASAKAKIEEDFDKKKKQIELRQFKTKQKLALANIAIDTAQAIVGLWVKPGFPAAIPMAITMGALGIIQAGIIASQKPPQYWKGTDNAQAGLAWTQERGAEIILDKNDRIKSLGSSGGAKLTMMEKGDKVKTASETKQIMFDNDLNSIMASNGISNAPKIEIKNGMTKGEMKEVMMETLGSMPMESTIIDVNGFKRVISNGHSRTITNSNRVSGKGIRV